MPRFSKTCYHDRGRRTIVAARPNPRFRFTLRALLVVMRQLGCVVGEEGTGTTVMRWIKGACGAIAKTIRFGCLLIVPAWIVGQIFRDVYWTTGILFYIPTPAILLALAITCVDAFVRRRRRQACVVLAAALVPVCMILFVENRVSPSRDVSGPAQLRSVHWNVFRGHLGWEAMRETLIRYDADLYVLSEVPFDLDASEFPDYQFLQLGEMAVLAKGPVELHSRLSRGELDLYWITWRTAAGPVEVFVADISSSLRIHRDPVLRRLLRFVEQEEPDLILGDLNAPRRSRALCPLPAGYRHAYDTAGSGWSYTWPVPVPLLAIDQCMHGASIHPVEYRLDTSPRSDHRIQSFDFRLVPSRDR